MCCTSNWIIRQFAIISLLECLHSFMNSLFIHVLYLYQLHSTLGKQKTASLFFFFFLTFGLQTLSVNHFFLILALQSYWKPPTPALVKGHTGWGRGLRLGRGLRCWASRSDQLRTGASGCGMFPRLSLFSRGHIAGFLGSPGHLVAHLPHYYQLPHMLLSEWLFL